MINDHVYKTQTWMPWPDICGEYLYVDGGWKICFQPRSQHTWTIPDTEPRYWWTRMWEWLRNLCGRP